MNVETRSIYGYMEHIWLGGSFAIQLRSVLSVNLLFTIECLQQNRLVSIGHSCPENAGSE